MSITATVRWLFAGDDGIIYECRDCRTTLESTERKCLTCSSTAIVEFDVSVIPKVRGTFTSALNTGSFDRFLPVLWSSTEKFNPVKALLTVAQ